MLKKWQKQKKIRGKIRMRTNGKIAEIYKVIQGEHKDPFSVLGMHVINTFFW